MATFGRKVALRDVGLSTQKLSVEIHRSYNPLGSGLMNTEEHTCRKGKHRIGWSPGTSCIKTPSIRDQGARDRWTRYWNTHYHVCYEKECVACKHDKQGFIVAELRTPLLAGFVKGEGTPEWLTI